ncbi:hypothetical protein [Novosphingobium panipatense]|uniref:hypothetical protein n=1 Tax=Novosphingobium panipatense TaxID=428991 RepID=UPI003607FE37
MFLTLLQSLDETAHLHPRIEEILEGLVAGEQRPQNDTGGHQERQPGFDRVPVRGEQKSQSDGTCAENKNAPSGEGQGLKAIAAADRSDEDEQRDGRAASRVRFAEKQVPPAAEGSAEQHRCGQCAIEIPSDLRGVVHEL